MQTVLITGGTGLVGKAITKLLLLKGYKVIVLTRQITPKQIQQPNLQYAIWDIKQQTIDVTAFEQADYIFHLAGAGVVDKKWTTSYQQQIVDSRVNSSKLLIKYLHNSQHKIKAIISASAIGWYGADTVESVVNGFTETDPCDNSFLGNTCQLWEQSIEPVTALGVRLVKYRIGIVLSNQGGALAAFKQPLQFGIAGILGSGKQIISWIHIDDLCRLFLLGIENNELHGSYNAVAPSPISNKVLTITLAKTLKGSFYIPMHVPAFVLKLMLGQRSIEVLKSTTVSANKIKQAGFVYQYPSIQAALQALATI
jgi:uncharacterized protein